SELPFWQGVTARPAPVLLKGGLDPNREVAATARHVECTLPTEATAALLTHVPAAFHARINDVLLSALMLAAANWRGGRGENDNYGLSLRLNLEGHGREPFDPTIDLTRTVEWFTSLYPMHLDPGAIDLDDALAGSAAARLALKRVKKQLRAVPHNGLG